MRKPKITSDICFLGFSTFALASNCAESILSCDTVNRPHVSATRNETSCRETRLSIIFRTKVASIPWRTMSKVAAALFAKDISIPSVKLMRHSKALPELCSVLPKYGVGFKVVSVERRSLS